MYHVFFIHSSVNRHLGCSRVLTIVNSVAVDIGVHGFAWIIVLSGHTPRTSLVAQMVKRLLIMWETQDGSLGWEDPLEKEVATHSSIFAWKIPWTEEPGGLQSTGWQRVGHD